MLSSSAYSIRQKSRLAISLSWIGGYTNVIAILFCIRAVSHMTGTTTSLAVAISEGSWATAKPLVLVLGPFFLGAVSSALMTETAKSRGLRSKYVLPIAIEALLLCGFAIAVEMCPAAATTPAHVLDRYYLVAAAIAACAMGLQNATITKISGSVVRTTHLTGVITDLGLEGTQLVLWLLDGGWTQLHSRSDKTTPISQRHPSLIRVALLASILGSFLFGAVVGGLAFPRFHGLSMLMPVGFLVFIVGMDWYYPIADIRELDATNDPELKLQGILKSILPPELGIYRLSNPRGKRHRAPNFQLWVDRLPEHWRVVILVLSPQTQFNSNAFLDLHAALQKLQASERSLIIAGITSIQYKALQELGIADAMDIENLCPDLEFAIARGMAMARPGNSADEELITGGV
ncbi:MAG TPA: YoaK family protein [Tepidisphaeraceae bacterium]|jgi:uncharacterized membrane protein YoaK (UPF0700 family)